jgi:hypothetical protein
MAGLLAIFAELEEIFCGNGPRLAWLMHGKTANGWVVLQLRAVHAAEIRKLRRAGISKSENRPTVADRPYLGSPDSGLAYFL